MLLQKEKNNELASGSIGIIEETKVQCAYLSQAWKVASVHVTSVPQVANRLMSLLYHRGIIQKYDTTCKYHKITAFACIP